MRSFRVLLATLALALNTGGASAQMMQAIVGAKDASYTGPGDITAFTSWYGLRAYSAAIAVAGTAKLINVMRSDNHAKTCDVLVAADGSGGLGLTASCATGGDNGQSASSFCNGTTCGVVKAYDAVGGVDQVSSLDGASFPVITMVFNCLNTTLPCWQNSNTAGGAEFKTAANFTPATGTVSISGVGNRSSGTGEFLLVQENGGNNRSKVISGNTNWACLGGTSGQINVAAADAAWHAQQCVETSGTNNSFDNVDGTVSTGTLVTNTTAGKTIIMQNNGSAGTVIRMTEAGFADNVAWSTTTAAALQANQKAYWGTP